MRPGRWAIAATASAAYVVALGLALAAGSDEVRVAAIAVEGTAVGAVAGVAGSIAGAQTQAQSANTTAKLEAASMRELRLMELEGQRDRMLLEHRVAWAERDYDQLAQLLAASRDLVGTAPNKAVDQAVGDGQVVETHADMLRANPLISLDSELAGFLRQYAERAIFDAIQASGGSTPVVADDGYPGSFSDLGDEIASRVSVRIREETAIAFRRGTG